MKALFILLLLTPGLGLAQIKPDQKEDAVKIHQLIGKYSQARESRDTVLLKEILMDDIDQLVSNGEWRTGIRQAIDGMLKSSGSNPGTRQLKVDRIKFLNGEIALVDCKYIITDPNGAERNLWSSFLIQLDRGDWKISAIRNMNPTGQ